MTRGIAAPEELSRRPKIKWIAVAVGTAILTVFVLLDVSFRVRDRASQAAAYRKPDATRNDRKRVKSAIRYRIGQLLRPDEGAGAISGGRAARLVEIGLLHGRLALLEEEEGNAAGRDHHMSDAVKLLREAGILKADEQYVRTTIARQNLLRSAVEQ